MGTHVPCCVNAFNAWVELWFVELDGHEWWKREKSASAVWLAVFKFSEHVTNSAPGGVKVSKYSQVAGWWYYYILPSYILVSKVIATGIHPFYIHSSAFILQIHYNWLSSMSYCSIHCNPFNCSSFCCWNNNSPNSLMYMPKNMQSTSWQVTRIQACRKAFASYVFTFARLVEFFKSIRRGVCEEDLSMTRYSSMDLYGMPTRWWALRACSCKLLLTFSFLFCFVLKWTFWMSRRCLYM